MKLLKQFESPHNPEIDEKFHQFNLSNISNLVYWRFFFESAKHVKGDIVECGIGRGRSLISLCALNYLLDEEEGGQRHIVGYDSFDGFPEPSQQDTSYRNPQKGEWSNSPSGKYKYSIEFTQQVLAQAGIPLNKIALSLHKGFFSDTLPHHPKRPIAMLHIDGDLYASYRDVLHNLYDLVVPGGIIVFDDFQAKKPEQERFPGARIAVEEFFGEDIDKLQVSPGGTFFLVKSQVINHDNSPSI